jgi:hypothetical protein
LWKELEKKKRGLSLQPPNGKAAMREARLEFIKVVYGNRLGIIFGIISEVVWKLRKGDYLCSR